MELNFFQKHVRKIVTAEEAIGSLMNVMVHQSKNPPKDASGSPESTMEKSAEGRRPGVQEIMRNYKHVAGSDYEEIKVDILSKVKFVMESCGGVSPESEKYLLDRLWEAIDAPSELVGFEPSTLRVT